MYSLWREILQSSIVCLSNSFSNSIVSAMPSFRGAMIIFKEYSQPSILSTVLYIFLTLKSATIHFLLRHLFSVYFKTSAAVKQTSYQSGDIFRAASIILKWEQQLEAATFWQKDFFRTPSCLEELLLLITTSW